MATHEQQHRRLRQLRWTAFALVVAAYVLSFFHRVAPAAIAGELSRAFNTSGAALGSLAASYFYIYTLMQIPTGVLVDTLGVRRIVTLGGLIAGVGSVLFGAAETLTAASVGRLLVGLGVSVMFLAILKINAVWFRDRQFATVSGLTVLLGNLGSVLAAAPLVWVLGFVSWRSVFVLLGIFSALLAVATWFGVRDNPAEAGLPSVRELDGHAPHAVYADHWLDGLWEVVRNRATWAGFWPAFGVAGTLLAFAGLWAVPYLTQAHDMTRAEATNHTSLLLIGFAIGAFAIGIVSDRIGRRRPLLLGGIVVYAVLWLPLLAVAPLARGVSLALFAAIGLAGSCFTLVWAVAKEVNRPALSGMATSVVNTGAFLGVALLQPLVGWAMDLGWDGRLVEGVRVYSAANYRVGLGLMFVCVLVAFIGALTVRETHSRYAIDVAPRAARD